LVAVAAIVASMTVVRHRHEQRGAERQPPPETPPATARLDLDGIRAAGF
jgi:hypothetical protein